MEKKQSNNLYWISARLRFPAELIIPPVTCSTTKLPSLVLLLFFFLERKTPASDRDTIESKIIPFCPGYFLSRKKVENSYTIMIFTSCKQILQGTNHLPFFQIPLTLQNFHVAKINDHSAAEDFVWEHNKPWQFTVVCLKKGCVGISWCNRGVKQ